MTEKKVTVTQADALKFLEGATRNWRKMPKLSAEDVEDVADALHWFAQHRTRSVGEGEPVAVIGKDWQLLWASAEALTAIVERTGIKIGSPLYASPKTTDSVDAVREAAQGVIDNKFSTYKARNGREVGIQGDDGEKVWLVHSDYIHALEAALQTQPAARDVMEALRDARMFVELVRLRATREGDIEQASEAADSLREIDAALSQPAGEGL